MLNIVDPSPPRWSIAPMGLVHASARGCRCAGVLVSLATIAACAATSVPSGPDTPGRARGGAREDAGAPAQAMADAARVEPIHAINLEKWADPSWSRVHPLTRDYKHCVREAGCPYAPVQLPKCPEGQRFVDFDQLASYAGVEVVVLGRLELGGKRLMVACHTECLKEKKCPDCGCWWSDVGGEGVGLAPVADPKRGFSYLNDDEHPYAFSCPGDDTAVCCGFSAGGTVLVHGVSAPGGQSITHVSMCSLGSNP